MIINPDKIVSYYNFLPEMPACPKMPTNADLLEIEIKVKKYIEDLQAKSSCCWEKTTSIASTLGTLYRIAWLPYTMLKSPLAFHMKMSSTSVEKNIEVLSEVTPTNLHRSLMTSSVRRAVPNFSLSSERASSMSGWVGNIAFLTPLVYAPAWNTISCISHGTGVLTQDIHQIVLDTGNCLRESSKIYQGPEAVVGLVTALALGVVAKTIVSFAAWTLLKDRELAYRYDTLNKIYCDVAMNLKGRWDVAVVEKNETEMENLRTIALKISNALPLINSGLLINAWLTTDQVKDLIEKLSWSCSYITLETGKPKPPVTPIVESSKVTESAPVIAEVVPVVAEVVPVVAQV